jgi:acyl-CoA thioester hydrolase
MLRECVMDLHDSPIVCLVVETGCQYFSPISFPDTVHCGLRVARLGNSSVRFEIGIFRNDENAAVAQGHFVHVACDRETHRPATMPAAMRAALEKLQLAGS